MSLFTTQHYNEIAEVFKKCKGQYNEKILFEFINTFKEDNKNFDGETFIKRINGL